MKKYEVVLTKSYLITIKAKNEKSAKRYCEFYTGDITDISNGKNTFRIEDIDCKMNEAGQVNEIT